MTTPACLLMHQEGDVQLAARVVEAGQAPLAGLRDGGALSPVVRHHQLHRLRDVRQTLLHLRRTPARVSNFCEALVEFAVRSNRIDASVPATA